VTTVVLLRFRLFLVYLRKDFIDFNLFCLCYSSIYNHYAFSYFLGNTILHNQTRFTVFPNTHPKCIRPTATKFSIRSYTIKWVCLTLVTFEFVIQLDIYLYWPLFLNWYKICRLLIILSVEGVCFHLTKNGIYDVFPSFLKLINYTPPFKKSCRCVLYINC